MADFYDNIFKGKKQRGFVVERLVDELDSEDRQEIHRYVQNQTALRYFSSLKKLAAQMDSSGPGRDDVYLFFSKVCQLAIRWESITAIAFNSILTL